MNSSPLELERRDISGLAGGEGYAELAGLGADDLDEWSEEESQCDGTVEWVEWKDCAGDGERDEGLEYESRRWPSTERVGERAIGASKGTCGSAGREGNSE